MIPQVYQYRMRFATNADFKDRSAPLDRIFCYKYKKKNHIIVKQLYSSLYLESEIKIILYRYVDTDLYIYMRIWCSVNMYDDQCMMIRNVIAVLSKHTINLCVAIISIIFFVETGRLCLFYIHRWTWFWHCF